MQQRQSSVAAFVHYCFLARRDPELAQFMLSGVDSSTSIEESELSELVESLADWCSFQTFVDPMSLVWLLCGWACGPTLATW
jgi:hypothetical protein